MSQAQILRPQRSCGQTQDSRHQFSRLQPGDQYTPHSFGPSTQQLHHFANPLMMVQPMQATMQRQYRPEELQQRQSWVQQQLPLGIKSSLNMNDRAAHGYAMALEQYWGSAPGRDQSSAWDNTQIIVPDSNSQFLHNSNLTYNPDAAQHVAAQHHSSYGGQLSWTASAMRGGIAGTGASVSDFDSINSLSPQSYLSDGAEASFSPSSVPDQASPRGDWKVSSSSVQIKQSSPQYPPSFSYSSLAPAHNNSFRQLPDASGLSGNKLGMAASTSSTQAGQFAHAPITSFNDDHQSSPDGSLTSADSSKSSWYMPGFSPPQSGVRLAQQNARAHEAQSDNNISASSTSSDSFSSYLSTSGSGSHSVLHPQSNYQARFQVPRTSDAQAQRQRNDELLIQGKQDGLTYREIRKKMLGEKPAESTLRGRYRSLTKARKDRVRKPLWHRRDIELLNGFVGRELERIEKTLSNPSATSVDQKLIKVRWKEVADYIHERGGSYHFGNSTCKRKWKELNYLTK